MSTQTADTETAPTTATTETTLSIPEREAVLKHFAKVAMNEEPQEAPASAPTREPEKTADDEALSQPTEETAPTEAPTEAERLAGTLAPPEGEPEKTDEDKLEEGDDAELPPETQEKINRRIGKEVAKTKAANEAREALEVRLAEVEAKLAEKPAKPTGPVPLSEIHDPRKLAEEKTRAEEALWQAEELLERIQDEPEAVEKALQAASIKLTDADGNESYDEITMRKFLRGVKIAADKSLRKAIPEREKFLAQAETFASEAFAYMPELKDAKSERSKLFRQVIQETPGLQSRPDWPIRAALGVEVLEKLKTRLAGTPAPPVATKPKRELPVTIPAPRTQAPAAARTRAAPLDAKAMADQLLEGNKSTRLDYIRSLMK